MSEDVKVEKYPRIHTQYLVAITAFAKPIGWEPGDSIELKNTAAGILIKNLTDSSLLASRVAAYKAAEAEKDAVKEKAAAEKEAAKEAAAKEKEAKKAEVEAEKAAKKAAREKAKAEKVAAKKAKKASVPKDAPEGAEDEENTFDEPDLEEEEDDEGP